MRGRSGWRAGACAGDLLPAHPCRIQRAVADRTDLREQGQEAASVEELDRVLVGEDLFLGLPGEVGTCHEDTVLAALEPGVAVVIPVDLHVAAHGRDAVENSAGASGAQQRTFGRHHERSRKW